jgi:hypothetical protein
MDLRRAGEESLTDDRVSESNGFVERFLAEADHRRRHLFSSVQTGRQPRQIIPRRRKDERISIQELQRGCS